MVEDVEYGSFFIDAHIHSHRERNVAYDHTESDWNQKQWLPFLDNTKRDEYQSDAYHHEVLPSAVVESGELPELLQTLYYGLH